MLVARETGEQYATRGRPARARGDECLAELAYDALEAPDRHGHVEEVARILDPHVAERDGGGPKQLEVDGADFDAAFAQCLDEARRRGLVGAEYDLEEARALVVVHARRRRPRVARAVTHRITHHLAHHVRVRLTLRHVRVARRARGEAAGRGLRSGSS